MGISDATLAKARVRPAVQADRRQLFRLLLGAALAPAALALASCASSSGNVSPRRRGGIRGKRGSTHGGERGD